MEEDSESDEEDDEDEEEKEEDEKEKAQIGWVHGCQGVGNLASSMCQRECRKHAWIVNEFCLTHCGSSSLSSVLLELRIPCRTESYSFLCGEGVGLAGDHLPPLSAMTHIPEDSRTTREGSGQKAFSPRGRYAVTSK